MIAVVCAVVALGTVNYSGLKPGKAYQPSGTDQFGLVLSTDPSELANGLGPPGAFIATSPSHESHFNDPGIPVTYTLTAVHETQHGTFKFTPLPVEC